MLQSPPAPRERGAAWIGQPIVLVGLMGAGKSTVGRRLATRLGLPFVDADTEIESAAGMSISDIFAQFGEAYFRDGERRVIQRLIDGRPKVIATGGGAFVNDETRALILAEALAIWLDAPVEVLAERVRRHAEHRHVNHGPAHWPLPHPSWRTLVWASRNPWFEAEVIPALRAEVRRLVG